VLNNPHKKQAPPKAHSSLPAVPPVDLPRVRRKDFDGYLRAVAPEYERFEKSNQLGREGAAQLAAPPESPTTPRPIHSAPSRSLPPLESVPSIFFSPTFNLGDPQTFDIVTEQNPDDSTEDSDPASLSRSLPLLEKFSHYADTVEQHLIQEISLRSTPFFAALTNLRSLQSESSQCLSRIHNLRARLKEIDAKRGLEVVRKEGKMRNLGKVKEGIKVVGEVVEMTGVAKALVGAGQWGEALGAIEEMQRLWKEELQPVSGPPRSSSLLSGPRTADGRSSPLPTMSENPPSTSTRKLSIPLSFLKAFAALPNHLRNLIVEITASLTSELINVLRHDLDERINNGNPKISSGLEDRLTPLLHGLTRTNGVKEGMSEWREVVMNEVRGTIAQVCTLF
jgi:vacuolar protein sorting-associated protein 54